MKLVERKCGAHFQLVDESVIQLLNTPQAAPDMENDDVPIWGDGEDEEEEDAMDFVDKEKDEESVIEDEITTQQGVKANQESNLSFDGTDENVRAHCKQSVDCFSAECTKQAGMCPGHLEKKESGNRFLKEVHMTCCRASRPFSPHHPR